MAKSDAGQRGVRRTNDSRQVERAGREDQLAEEQVRLDIENILQLESGRRFIQTIIRESGVFDLDLGPAGIEQCNFDRGRQSIAAELVARVKKIDSGYLTSILNEPKFPTSEEVNEETGEDDGS